MIKNYETYLPIFSGFYESLWMNDNTYDTAIEMINGIRNDKGLPEITFDDDMELNYTDYEYEVVNHIKDWLYSEVDFIKSIVIQKIIHPREYNFKTDSVNIAMDVDTDIISKHIYENKEEFSKYLKYHYTSFDGFMSYYSNSFADWEENTHNFKDFEETEHELGSVIEFILTYVYEINEYDILEDFEGYLEPVDMEHETTKIQCENCEDWYSTKDLKNEYDKKVTEDLNLVKEIGTRGNVVPKPVPFNVWLKNNNYCPYCDEENELV